MVDPIEAAALAILPLVFQAERTIELPSIAERAIRRGELADEIARAAYEVLAPILREERARAMQEAALRALRTAQYDPAPYTKVKVAIEALSPAEIVKGIGQ